VRRKKEQSIKYADQAGNAIVTLRDERAFTVLPLVGHLFAPNTRGRLLSVPLRGSGCFSSFHAVIVEAVASQNVKRECAEW
jgi:hypothetical protein